MLNDYLRGARYAVSGFGLVRRRGIRVYALIPLLINAVLFGAGIWFGATAFQDFLAWLLPAWLDIWLLHALLWLLFGIACVLISFYAFTLVANLIGAPFNGVLAERVEGQLHGGPRAPGVERSLAAEAVINIGAELRKMLYLVGWSLPLLVLFWVPVINIVAVPLWFAFGAWMLTLEYVDCPLGNHGFSFREVRGLIATRRRLALGFGSVVMGLTIAPGLNLVAMPVAVCGATAMIVDEFPQVVAE